jgi:hypothetical protein
MQETHYLSHQCKMTLSWNDPIWRQALGSTGTSGKGRLRASTQEMFIFKWSSESKSLERRLRTVTGRAGDKSREEGHSRNQIKKMFQQGGSTLYGQQLRWPWRSDRSLSRELTDVLSKKSWFVLHRSYLMWELHLRAEWGNTTNFAVISKFKGSLSFCCAFRVPKSFY